MGVLPALVLALAPLPQAQESPAKFALRGARVLTVSGDPIDDAVVLVEDGRIAAVGPAAEVALDQDVSVRDVSGLVLIPGLVDTHSHLGVISLPTVPANYDGNDSSNPVQPSLRAVDSINPADPRIRMATAGGVTTANIMPGSGNAVGGQTAYVKLRGDTLDRMLIDLGDQRGGMKMANGENPKRNYGARDRAPMTRMKLTELQRDLFVRAQVYRDRWADYRTRVEAGETPPAPERDLELEPVVEILERRRTVHFHSHRADDLMSAVRLSREFGFEVVLQHATEAYKVAGQLAAAQVPISITLVDAPGGKHEAVDFRYDNPARCEAAGVRVALNSDDPITHSRVFLRSGALAVRGGMSPEGALRALTLEPAAMMHLEERIGSIEAGKDADLVLLSGEPFSIYTRVLATWIDGELVFDFERDEDRPYALGGFAADVPVAKPAAVAPPAPVAAPEADPNPVRGNRFAVLAGRLYTGTELVVEDAAVLVEDGRITLVAKRSEVELPGDLPVVTAAVVTPGFIDAHSSVGLSGYFNVRADQDHDELTGPNQAALRVLDGFNSEEVLLSYLLSHGVTTLQCVPGPSNPIGGQAGIFRTFGRVADDMTVRSPSAVVFNLGESPKRAEGGERPTTRMGTVALIRRALQDARNYAAESEPTRNLANEALAPVAAGQVPALFVVHRRDDIATALRIGAEFGLQVRISQASEAWLAAGELRGSGVPVLAGPTLQGLDGIQGLNASFANAAILADAGVEVCLTSGFEAYVPKTHVILFEAAQAAINGLGRERALQAITLTPARVLGIDDQYGSIEPGKVADLVLFDGDPFEYTTSVTRVFGGGQLVFERP